MTVITSKLGYGIILQDVYRDTLRTTYIIRHHSPEMADDTCSVQLNAENEGVVKKRQKNNTTFHHHHLMLV